ncbi:MAG: formyltransferase family protein [Candidatus Woesearchaeota archaeon]
MTLSKLYHPKSEPMRLAIFMSGSGTNAKKILERFLADTLKTEGNSFDPILIFSDNPDSNAERIGGEDYKDQGLTLSTVTNPIREFYQGKCCDNLKDFDLRAAYDAQQVELLKDMRIDAVALAGYDWALSRECLEATSDIVWMNVHPGDLRKKKANGEPAYRGLGWVPSAKAILAGEDYVHSSVHLVTAKVDEGGLLAISEGVLVQDEIWSLDTRANIIWQGSGYKPIKRILDYIRDHPDMEEKALAWRFPLFGAARELQETLKVKGDWVIYPETICNVAKGRYESAPYGNLLFDGKPIPKGVQFKG